MVRATIAALLLGLGIGLAAPGHAGDEIPLTEGLTAFQRATQLAQEERYEEAVTALDQAVPAFEKLEDASFLGIVLTCRGFCLDRLGQHARALPDFERAVDLPVGASRQDAEARAALLDQLGTCLLHLGRGNEALARVRDALALQERLADGEDSQGLAKALNDCAFCLLALGRPKEALACAEPSVAMGRRLHPGGHASVAAALDNLATCYDDLGRFPAALPLREESLTMTRAFHAEAHPQVGQGLANLACTLQFLGRPEDARPRFAEALAIWEEAVAGDHPERATAMNNLAMCLAELGRYAEALPLVERALAMAKRLFPGDHPQVAMLLHNRGVTQMELGKLGEALETLDAALAMRRRLFGDAHPDVARTLNDRAHCLERLGRTEEAIEGLREALGVARRIESPLRHVHAANLGTILLKHGRAAEAAPLFAEAMEAIESRRSAARGLTALDRAAYVGTLTHFRAFDGMVRVQLALGNPEAALAALERSRARSLLDLLEQSRVDPLATMRRQAREAGDAERLRELDAVQAELAASDADVGRHVQAFEAARARRDLSFRQLRALQDECTQRLADARRRQASAARRRARLVEGAWEAAEPAGVDAIRALLADGDRLLLYSINDLDGALIVVPPSGGAIAGHVLTTAAGEALDETRLGAMVDAFLSAIQADRGGRGDRQAEVQKYGHDLFRALVPASVWKDLREARRVYLVPHGALGRVPFEALVVEPGETPRFWIDDGPPIAYGASGAALCWSRDRLRAQRKDEPLVAAVAIGDPEFAGSLPALPGTRREVEAVVRRLAPQPVEALLGPEATKQRLFDAAPRARWLHIATHQVLGIEEGVAHPWLAFTPGAEQVAGDDGHLRLEELFEAWRGRLAHCELVVLSACETQVGREIADEGVFAMPWGFQFAGAPTVIASLWRLDDDSAATLFDDFYARIAKGDDVLAAFTEARRSLRQTSPQPYYWAPLVFLGAP